MRHQDDREAGVVESCNGERDAVDRDRALLDAVAEHLRGRVNPDGLRTAAHTADTVNVALHHVAAERLPCAERRLDVDAVVRRERAESRAIQRFGDDIERKPVAVVLDDSQADTVDRDRVGCRGQRAAGGPPSVPRGL